MRFWFAAALGTGIFVICFYGLYAASHLNSFASLWR
jgi:hypothetical protein